MSSMSKPADREFPVLTLSVSAVCVAIFIAMNTGYVTTIAGAEKFGEYTEFAIYDGAYWGVITTAFVHKEVWHIAFNLYWFWILGGAFERRFGIPLFAAFILGSAFVSSEAQLATGSVGIGLSGVGYALFGFAWLARTRIPEFARAMPNQMVTLFFGWGVFCLVATQIGFMHVANAAHLGGLVFGAAIGWMYAQEKHRVLVGIGFGSLLLLSFLPLFWNPLSVDWVSVRAEKQYRARDYAGAERSIKQALQMGQDPVWAWSNLAEIYGLQNREPDYSDAVRRLRSIDSEAAKEITDRMGEPD